MDLSDLPHAACSNFVRPLANTGAHVGKMENAGRKDGLKQKAYTRRQARRPGGVLVLAQRLYSSAPSCTWSVFSIAYTNPRWRLEDLIL